MACQKPNHLLKCQLDRSWTLMAASIGMSTDNFDPAAALGVDGRPVLQARIRVWGKVTTFVHLAFWALWLLNNLDPESDPPSPLIVFALSLAALVYTFAWVVGSGAARSVRFLKVTDYVLFGLLGWCFATGLAGHPVPHMVAYEAITGIMFLLFTRALLLPSSPRRTLLVSMVAVVPGLVTAFALRERLAPPGVGAEAYWFSYLSWMMITCGVCTVASRVLYGLERKVHDARRLGQYVLLEKLGEGGMGIVYRARHAMLRRPTAVKLLSAHGESWAIERFEQEVQQLAKINHPNIVTVHDFGRTSTGVFYFAMELLEGLDLERLVSTSGPQPADRVVHVLIQTCIALARAHREGLVHRDVKPANIFLCRDHGDPDRVKVLDFGLVKDLKARDEVASTGQDHLLGTPLYMSPEACASPATVGTASDLYSLGAVAYFLLTGTPPFIGRTTIEIAAQHIHRQPPPLRGEGSRAISAELELVVLRCLRKAAGERFETALELRDALAACPEGGRWTSERAEACWVPYDASSSRASVIDALPLLDTIEIGELGKRVDEALA